MVLAGGSPRPGFTLYAIMSKSISVKRKKPGRPATGTEPLYGVRIADELMGRIEKWAKDNSASRSEAIRRLVELGLKAKGK
jgi:Ribbon-helix-helix protein, copG family